MKIKELIISFPVIDKLTEMKIPDEKFWGLISFMNSMEEIKSKIKELYKFEYQEEDKLTVEEKELFNKYMNYLEEEYTGNITQLFDLSDLSELTFKEKAIIRYLIKQ